tara:strand:- start:25 stop:456 length:432 start_codon:yes stop_codon:yes gene_type:complete
MTRRYAYPIDLTEDDDGSVFADFPDLAGASTDGADRSEALAQAADCLAEALAACIADKRDIAPPSPARGRPLVEADVLTTAKAALYSAVRDAGVSNVELSRRLGVAEGEVRRMLDPRHATKIGRLESALAALGKRLAVDIRAA